MKPGMRVTEAELGFESKLEVEFVLASELHFSAPPPWACGHDHLSKLSLRDLTTYDRDIAYLAGVPYAGVTPLS